MSDDEIGLPGGAKRIVVAFADHGADEPNYTLRTAATVHHVGEQRCSVHGKIRAHRVEGEAFGSDLGSVAGAGGDSDGVATAAQFDADGHVRMNVAVGAEGGEEDARQLSRVS